MFIAWVLFKQFMKVMLKGCYTYKMIFSEQSFLRFMFDYSRIFVSTSKMLV